MNKCVSFSFSLFCVASSIINSMEYSIDEDKPFIAQVMNAHHFPQPLLQLADNEKYRLELRALCLNFYNQNYKKPAYIVELIEIKDNDTLRSQAQLRARDAGSLFPLIEKFKYGRDYLTGLIQSIAHREDWTPSKTEKVIFEFCKLQKIQLNKNSKSNLE